MTVKSRVQDSILRYKGQKGFALPLALLILFILTVTGMFFLYTTQVEIQIAGSERKYKIAFYAAESGIEAGRAALNALKTADSGNWDKLLNGTQDLNTYLDGLNGRNVGNASFSLQVADNDDLDGDLLVDTDNLIILTSTGNYNNAQSYIEATVRYVASGDQYAQEHYDTDSSGKAVLEDVAVTNTQRWQ